MNNFSGGPSIMLESTMGEEAQAQVIRRAIYSLIEELDPDVKPLFASLVRVLNELALAYQKPDAIPLLVTGDMLRLQEYKGFIFKTPDSDLLD